MENEPVQSMSEMKKNSGKGLWLSVGLIIVVLIVVYVFWGKNRNASDEITTPTPTVSVSTASPTPPSVVTPGTEAPTPTAKTFTVIGKNFSFSPTEIKVKKGDTVKITLQNTGGTHDLVIDEFNVRTPRIKSGETATVEFVADKIGRFEYYCSVTGHRAMGMKGLLIVE